jgi:hypothetical protein
MRLTLVKILISAVLAFGLGAAGAVHAQAGPPFLTNDPGTFGNANWEINPASNCPAPWLG